MEDFTLARSHESKQISALQNEFLDSQLPKAGQKLELAAVLTVQDNQSGPGKDVADRLDRELRDFATAKLDNPSANMQSFQKMIGKFCDSADKKAAMEELGTSYSKLKGSSEKEAEETYKEIEAEAAKNPARKGLESNYGQKVEAFFDKLGALPAEQSNKVYDLLEWKEGESRTQHQDRVRAGLKDDKAMLSAYNSMEEASDKIEASKSAREKGLDATHKQQIDDYRAMGPVAEKAYIRSTIEY